MQPLPRHEQMDGVPDPDQRSVLEHRGGALLVLGAPGTGKTQTAVRLVRSRIADGVPPDACLVLAPTRAAAALAPGVQLIWNIRCADMDLSKYGYVSRGLPHVLARLSRLPAVVVTPMLATPLTVSPLTVKRKWPGSMMPANGART